MNQAQLTVPPPLADDHEDVAWALRAASAQWRRHARADAIAWVERAAETAEEVGEIPRSVELLQLVESLRRKMLDEGEELSAPVSSQAPPPPPPSVPSSGGASVSSASSVPASSPAPSSAPASVSPAPSSPSGVGAVPPRVGPPPPPPPPRVAPPGALPPLPPPRADLAGLPPLPPPRSSTGGAPPPPPLPPLPLTTRPRLQSIDIEIEVEDLPADPELGVAAQLEEEFEAEERQVEGAGSPSPSAASLLSGDSLPPSSGGARESQEESPVEFGELDFVEEAPTSRHSLPALEEVSAWEQGAAPLGEEPESSGLSSSLPPAELASSGTWDLSSPAEGELLEMSPEDLEKEFGVDLSVEPYWASPSAPSAAASSVRAVTAAELAALQAEAESLEAAQAEDDFAQAADESVELPSQPVVGLASVRPSRPPGAPDLIASHGLEPFRPAPSAELPWTAPVEPPSRPSQAPPSDWMQEPEPSDSAEERPLAELPSAVPASVLELVDWSLFSKFQGLPEARLQQLAAQARFLRLENGEEEPAPGAVLVLRGAVQVMPTILDASCAVLRKGEVLFTRGSLKTETGLRVLGFDPGTQVALLSQAVLDEASSASPEVLAAWQQVGDFFQALAGAVLGPLGDSMDEIFRAMVLEKCQLRRFSPGALVAQAGKPTDGLYIVGSGQLSLLSEEGAPAGELFEGDFLFPSTLLMGGAAPQTARAGEEGALTLYASRMDAHELLATCPPLIELLASL